MTTASDYLRGRLNYFSHYHPVDEEALYSLSNAYKQALDNPDEMRKAYVTRWNGSERSVTVSNVWVYTMYAFALHCVERRKEKQHAEKDPSRCGVRA
jgi:hypothetical protein